MSKKQKKKGKKLIHSFDTLIWHYPIKVLTWLCKAEKNLNNPIFLKKSKKILKELQKNGFLEYPIKSWKTGNYYIGINKDIHLIMDECRKIKAGELKKRICKCILPRPYQE